MQKRMLFLTVFALSLIPYVANAYTTQGINSLLASYDVPTAIVSSLKPVNLTYSGYQYVGLYSNNSLYFLINVTGGYSIVLNKTAIFNVIRSYTINGSFQKTGSLLLATNYNYSGKNYLGVYNGSTLVLLINITAPGQYDVVGKANTINTIVTHYTNSSQYQAGAFPLLSILMHAYQASSASALNACYHVTGFSSGLTCTLGNLCAACSTVPICHAYFSNSSINVGGPSYYGSSLGIFGNSVAKFGNRYATLNSSFSQYYNATSGASKSNLNNTLATLSNAYLSISNVSTTIGQSMLFSYSGPLFLPTVCLNYQNPLTAPWYCVALGLCPNPTYNPTPLFYANQLTSKINTLPLTNPQIMQIASNASNLENTYVYPVLSRQKLAQLRQILNTTLYGYNSLVNNTKVLLVHVRNATLQTDLLTLQSTYANATNNYISVNLMVANTTLAGQYSALSSLYAALNSTYSSLVSTAVNNTIKILELQMFGSVPAAVSNLAFTELQLNSLVTASNISNVSTLNSRLRSVSSMLSGYSTSPLSLAEVARSIDGPFIRALAGSMGLGYSGGVSLAPLLGSLLSLIIGMAVFAGVLLWKHSLHQKRRIAVNPRTMKHWRFIFLLIGAAIALYVVLTYSLLAYANSNAPFGAFRGAYAPSKYVVVAVNGTQTLNAYTCASKISARATAAGKNPIIASFSNGVCRVGNATSTVESCLAAYANSNIPVIILTQRNGSSISLYSLYGTALSMSGNNTLMNACYVSLMLK